MLPADQPLFMANRVLDNVFVGGHFAAEDEDFIFTNTISRVINTVAHQIPNRFQAMNVRYLSYQFDQNGTSVVLDARDERITQVVRFVNEAIEQDSNVLIHSQNGDSRSVILMAAYLIHRFHWPPHRALQFIATKRFNSRPHTNYVKQLHEFANRRRAKYGEFKDIFGSVASIKGLKLNFHEYLHRNTFLNAVMQQEDVIVAYRQKSPKQALIDAAAPVPSLGKGSAQQNKQQGAVVTFRDGLQTAQVPAQYAQFDANGNFVNKQFSSQLFRPKTPSYSSSQQVRCLPIRLDQNLLPAVSFDLDVQNQHVRRPDGYLTSAQPDLQQYAVAARPVSILKVHLENDRMRYDQASVVVSVDEFERMLRGQTAQPTQQQPPPKPFTPASVSQVHPTGSQHTSLIQRQTSAVVPEKPMITSKINQAISQTQVGNLQIGKQPLQVSTRPIVQQSNLLPSQQLGHKNNVFSRVRPPTPPRRAQGADQMNTQSQMMRPVQQQQVFQYSGGFQGGSQKVSTLYQSVKQGQGVTGSGLSSSMKYGSSNLGMSGRNIGGGGYGQPKWK